MKNDRSNSLSKVLQSGSLLIMEKAIQNFWLHGVPMEPNLSQARINLTFRKIKENMITGSLA